MRRQQGELTISSPDGDVRKETVTCGHCNCLVVIEPGADPNTVGGFCQQCMKHTCPREACNNRCVPFEKKLDAFERRAALRRKVTGDA